MPKGVRAKGPLRLPAPSLGSVVRRLPARRAEQGESVNPIRLEVDQTNSAVTLRVVGSSDQAFRGTFTLHMVGGGNQSTHQSHATLAAGERAILSTITLGGAERWSARLTVIPDDGPEYEEQASGPS